MKYLLWLVWFTLGATPCFPQTSASQTNERLIQYFQNQQYAQAAAYLQSAFHSDTANLHVLSLLGYAYYMSNQFSQATHCFAHLLTLDSSNTRARYYLGKINATKGDLPTALTYYCPLVEQQPGIARYYKELAKVYTGLNNANAAGWYNQLAHRANPNDPETIARLARYWLEQKRYRKADSIIGQALQQDSLLAVLITTGIQSAYVQEKYHQIFPLIQRLKTMHYISLKPFLLAAMAHFSLEQYDSCIAICQLITRNKMANRTTYYLQALSYKALRQYPSALAYLDTCIHMAIDPEANAYFSAKGAVLELLHQPTNALKTYDTAYYIFHQPLQLYNKARVYDAQFENYTTALRYYHRFLQKSSKRTDGKAKPVRDFALKRAEQLEQWKKTVERTKASPDN